MNEDLIGLAVTAMLTFGGARAYASRLRYRNGLPRLCGCGHGSGMHGPDGCSGPRVATSKERHDLPTAALVRLAENARCGCHLYDGAGPRAPR